MLLHVPPVASQHGLPTHPPVYYKDDMSVATPIIAALGAHHRPVAPGCTWNAFREEQPSESAARWKDLSENVARRGLWGV